VWAHDQPMNAWYVVGRWLAVRGYDLLRLPAAIAAYDLSASPEETQRAGRVPDAELLHEARVPMVAFAAGVVFLI
jgi:hypothetical protein